MTSENSETSDPGRLLLILTDKINLKRSDKYVTLSNLDIYFIWKNVKKLYKNNEFKITDSTWNEQFQLADESYSISRFQDYFEYILKKHEEKTVNLSIRIYINKIENRIMFKIKTGHYLEILTRETMQPLESTKNKITED